MVLQHFKLFVRERCVPEKEDCVKCITTGKALGQRSWKDVEKLVSNTIVTLNNNDAFYQLKLP